MVGPGVARFSHKHCGAEALCACMSTMYRAATNDKDHFFLIIDL